MLSNMELQTLGAKRVLLPRYFPARDWPTAAQPRQNHLQAQRDKATIAALARAAWDHEGCALGRETESGAEVVANFHATRHLQDQKCTDGFALAYRS